MSYIGSIGDLMAGAGMKESLKKAFDGVPKFPQILRALSMIMEEVSRSLLKDGKIT